MSATPNSLFRHYLDSLIQQGTTRTSLTDEARNVLRTWYVASRQGGRPAASAPASPEPPPLQAAVPVSAPAGKPEPPELFPQNREPASAITLPEGTMEDKLQYLRNLAQNWKPARELNSLRDTMVFATGNPHTKLMLIGKLPDIMKKCSRSPLWAVPGKNSTRY